MPETLHLVSFDRIHIWIWSIVATMWGGIVTLDRDDEVAVRGESKGVAGSGSSVGRRGR